MSDDMEKRVKELLKAEDVEVEENCIIITGLQLLCSEDIDKISKFFNIESWLVEADFDELDELPVIKLKIWGRIR